MSETKLQQINEELMAPVSKAYRKFFERFKEIEEVPVQDWKTIHILAYICKKYKEYYNLDYTFKFNNSAPSKSYEIYSIKKLSQMLSSNPEVLLKYVDWVFTNKVVERKKRITSLGYFVHPDLVNDYKFKFLFNKLQIDRSSPLPAEFKQCILKHDSRLTYIQNVGDFCFLYQQLSNGSYSAKNDAEILLTTLSTIDKNMSDLIVTGKIK